MKQAEEVFVNKVGVSGRYCGICFQPSIMYGDGTEVCSDPECNSQVFYDCPGCPGADGGEFLGGIMGSKDLRMKPSEHPNDNLKGGK